MKHLSKVEIGIFAGLAGLFALGIGLSYLGSLNGVLNQGMDGFAALASQSFVGLRLWVRSHVVQAALILPATVLAVFLWQARKVRRYF